jgi:hypothetical protein
MARVPEFYSVNEGFKPAPAREYHNNSACPLAREIPGKERRDGTDGYRLCKRCAELNALSPRESANSKR